ncbi:hypothetical protein CASFOL_037000 [Castilleja foliolosa]|uniref:RRM domain-containing protein n=1 Tax=Castilleja foliolosa TaxID=1961234 RepID=A0ABD3BPQ5_9LAMI
MDRNTRAQGDEPNRILLVTIYHMISPITEEVLHQVFSPHGFVEKIVTSQKSAELQALIQYESHQSAISARNFLQGRNIYDGCCQLDIQFSYLDELQVNFNNKIDTVQEECGRDITILTANIECKIKNRHDTHADCPEHTDDVKKVITDVAHMKDAIVDVSDDDDPISRTKLTSRRRRTSRTRRFGKVLLARPKIKRAENEFDINYKLVESAEIVNGEYLNPGVIYFLSYTLRTRWFFTRGRMLWLCVGQQGRGRKSRQLVETRLKELLLGNSIIFYGLGI